MARQSKQDRIGSYNAKAKAGERPFLYSAEYQAWKTAVVNRRFEQLHALSAAWARQPQIARIRRQAGAVDLSASFDQAAA